MNTTSFASRIVLATALFVGAPVMLFGFAASQPALAESSMDINDDNGAGVSSQVLTDTGDGEGSDENNSQETCSDFVDVSATNSRC